MAKFRKKPVVIDAILWDGEPSTCARLSDMGMTMESYSTAGPDGKGNGLINNLRIKTLEGTMTANHGDWIIKGLVGEFYPCKPDIFEASYEPA